MSAGTITEAYNTVAQIIFLFFAVFPCANAKRRHNLVPTDRSAFGIALAMSTEPFKVFVSCRGPASVAVANDLSIMLNRKQYTVSSTPSVYTEESILLSRKQIAEADFVVLLLTAGYLSSEQCLQEFAAALYLQQRKSYWLLLPVLTECSNPWQASDWVIQQPLSETMTSSLGMPLVKDLWSSLFSRTQQHPQGRLYSPNMLCMLEARPLQVAVAVVQVIDPYSSYLSERPSVALGIPAEYAYAASSWVDWAVDRLDDNVILRLPGACCSTQSSLAQMLFDRLQADRRFAGRSYTYVRELV